MGKVDKRIDYLDYCKAIAIFLVTFAHILGGMREQNAFDDSILILCYSVELPIFYFITGIQHALQKNDTKKNSIRKKAKRLLYPYMTFSILYVCFDVFIILIKLLLHKNVDIKMFIYDIIDMITTWGIGALWFLPTLFLAEVVFIYLHNKKVISLCISLAGIFIGRHLEMVYNDFLSHKASFLQYMGSYISRVLVAYSFVFLGYLGWKYLKSCIDKFKNNKRILIVSILLLFIGSYIALYNYDIVDLHFGYCRNFLATYSSAIILFIGIILFCSSISSGKCYILSWFGKHTLEIMALQIGTGYSVATINKVCEIFGLSIPGIIKAIIVTMIFLIIASLIVYIINSKVRWLILYDMGKNKS